MPEETRRSKKRMSAADMEMFLAGLRRDLQQIGTASAASTVNIELQLQEMGRRISSVEESVAGLRQELVDQELRETRGYNGALLKRREEPLSPKGASASHSRSASAILEGETSWRAPSLLPTD